MRQVFHKLTKCINGCSMKFVYWQVTNSGCFSLKVFKSNICENRPCKDKIWCHVCPDFRLFCGLMSYSKYILNKFKVALYSQWLILRDMWFYIARLAVVIQTGKCAILACLRFQKLERLLISIGGIKILRPTSRMHIHTLVKAGIKLACPCICP